MENILDFDFVLRDLEQDRSESALAALETARRTLGSERDSLFQQEEEAQNFRLYGAPFEGASPPDPPDWGKYISDCQSHLANQSKDLWVCVWLTEVLLAQHGFKGLADGFELMRRIIELHWDHLEPSPSGEEGPGYTVKLLSAVSRREAFVDAIRLAPISTDSGQFRATSAATIDSLDGGERAALIGDTPDEFILEVYLSNQRAIEEWERIDALLDNLSPDDKPPVAKVREALSYCLNQIETTYPQVALEDESSGQEPSTHLATVTNSPSDADNALSGDNHLRNREQAFKTLEALSLYFAKNEPNSPISDLLRQAARWGRMSFRELLQEVADDEDAREQILRLTGANQTDGKESGED
ncbi:MAG: hypothetical protein GY818_10990 [Planctomycetaceae bacterium]|nr:hypothetical protein [Planctomycetaceae bacterium]